MEGRYVVTLALAACAPDMARREQAVVGGALDLGDPAVVAIGRRPVACNATLQASCTGTLVAPRAVLTAAHCLEMPGPWAVFFGADTRGAGELRDVIAVHLHPQFDRASLAHDIAIAILDAPAPVTEVVLATAPLDASAVSTLVRVVGFGDDGTATVGIKRAGDSMITSVDAATFSAAPSPALSCVGDSGGPLFSGDLLVGVTSSGDPACATTSVNTDAGAYRSFIDPILLQTAPTTPAWQGLCAATCTTDDECALGLMCQPGRDGESRCTIPTLQQGDVADACDSEADCGGGACIRALGARDCQCLEPCAPVHGSSCQASRSPSALVLVTLVFLSRRRRRRS